MKKLLLCLCMCLMFVGCYSTPNSSVSGSLVKVSEDDNYSTYVIIGAGVIRVKNDKEVTIVDNNTIGVSLYSIGYGSAKLGIISDIVTQSKPNSNNIIEIKKGFPFTGIDIKIKKEDGK